MGLFSKIGLGIYYRIRRIKKALKNWRRFGVIIFGSLMLTAMSGAGAGITADQILTVTQVQPSGVILAQGATKQFTAASLDQYGQPILSGVTYSWQVVTSAAGAINQSGLFTAGLTSGQYNNAVKLTATKGASTKYSYATVTVQSGGNDEQLILTTVAVSPTSTILAKGATKQFTPYAYDQKGNILPGVTFSWTATAAGSISNSGLFTAGLTSGQYNNAVKLTATKGGSTKFAYATVTVQQGEQQDVLTTVVISPTGAILAKSATKQFTATAYNQNGSLMTGVSFSWQVVNSTAGTISQSGLFTAGQTAGQYSNVVKVTASKDSSTKYAYATITVQQGEQQDVLITVVISPTSAILAKSATKQFTATAYNQHGAVISGVSFTWNVVNAAAGTISNTGYFTAGLTSGQYNNTVKVTGTKDGVSKYAYATVTVQESPAKAWTLGVTPLSDVLTLTGSSVSRDFDFVATYNDGSGNVTLTSVSWQVIHPGQFSANGTINTAGLYTATQTGYDQIKLTASDGISTKEAWASVSVIAGPQPEEPYLAYVQVTPHPWMMDMNDTKLFDATSYDQNDNVISDSLISYTWSVVNGGGSINSASGLFTAGSFAGTFDHTARVKAIYQGNTRYGYATVIVNPIYTQAVLDRVEILPPSVTINRYNSFDFSAYAYDTNDNQMFSGVSYTWSVISGPGSVNQDGLYTATNSTNAATVQVEARQGGIQVYDTALVYITGSGGCTSILDRIELTPSTGYVNTGNSIDFDALAYDTAGCLVSADLWFSVSNDSNGYINQSGYFTARYNTGTFNDLVRVRAYRDGREVYDWATVVISTGVTPPPTSNYYVDASLRAMDETTGSAYQANEGDTILYTLRLTNNRTNALTNVKASMDVPEYATFISATSQSGAPLIYSRTITWEAGSLYSGESKTMLVRVRVNSSVPRYAVIRGKAYVKAYELGGGFWAYANDLPVAGTGGEEPGEGEPLVPTGAMEWILAAMTAMLATILTRQLIRTRKLLAQK